mgnify:CR=1 FL=1
MALEPVVITDASSGARAHVLPAIGFNCFRFEVPTPRGAVDLLWSAPEFVAGQGKPSHSGIPILFPFAGRIGGTSFDFEGRKYELSAGDGQGNAIHGFLLDRPWRVAEQTADRVVGTFQASQDDPALLEHWPADFRATAEYRVAGNALHLKITFENPDDKPLPFGLGIHPYFRVPLASDNAADCRVTVPVEYGWELEGLLPTGRTTSPPAARDLSGGMRFGDMKLDNVFGGLSFAARHCTATVADPTSGLTTSLRFDEQFTTCVVYNPPHREAVCVEPYTTLPDAFRLIDQAIDPHLCVLAPGASFETQFEIRLD